jgi:hypothetical protein
VNREELELYQGKGFAKILEKYVPRTESIEQKIVKEATFVKCFLCESLISTGETYFEVTKEFKWLDLGEKPRFTDSYHDLCFNIRSLRERNETNNFKR